MAITYPTFTDGAVLSAAQLNLLGDAVNTLRSAVETNGYAFPTIEITGTTTPKSFWLRHAHRWLWFRATSGTTPDVTMTVTPEGGAATTFGPFGNLDNHHDLDTVTGLNVGDFYELRVTTIDGSGEAINVFLVYEADA